jgi:hypothetical protein
VPNFAPEKTTKQVKHMRLTSSTFLKTLFVLSALLLLSACGSELTGIDAPEAVDAGQTFEVSVTHQFFEDDGSFNPADSPYGALVFGVIVPAGLTASPVANYQGTWDGVPQDLDLELQTGIPDTNFVEYLESDNAPAELIEYMRVSDCSTVLEELDADFEGAQVLFFQTTADLFQGPSPQIGDGGEFFFQLTADINGEGGEVAVIHGLLIGGPISSEVEPDQDVLGCSWYVDEIASEDEGRFIPDVEFASFIQFTSESLPVPVMGGAMIAILALLLAMVGVLVGRRKLEK